VRVRSRAKIAPVRISLRLTPAITCTRITQALRDVSARAGQ
jgi:hypothetical protein